MTDSEARSASTGGQARRVSNLLEILAAATDQDPPELAKGYTQYGPLKADAGEAVVELLAPSRTATTSCSPTPASCRHCCAGAGKARAVASATLQRAYDAIGFLPA